MLTKFEDAETHYQLCLESLRNSDHQNAALYAEKAAELGHSTAQFIAGNCYEYGQGVAPDAARAAYWYEKSAEQGYTDAMLNVGNLYMRGVGVAQNATKAAHWFEKAAEQGDVDAQYNIGVSYERGNGVKKDFTRAAYWYEKAAAHGHADAQHNLGRFYKYGRRGVKQDMDHAESLLEQSAAQGSAKAAEELSDVDEMREELKREERRKMNPDNLSFDEAQILLADLERRRRANRRELWTLLISALLGPLLVLLVKPDAFRVPITDAITPSLAASFGLSFPTFTLVFTIFVGLVFGMWLATFPRYFKFMFDAGALSVGSVQVNTYEKGYYKDGKWVRTGLSTEGMALDLVGQVGGIAFARVFIFALYFPLGLIAVAYRVIAAVINHFWVKARIRRTESLIRNFHSI